MHVPKYMTDMKYIRVPIGRRSYPLFANSVTREYFSQLTVSFSISWLDPDDCGWLQTGQLLHLQRLQEGVGDAAR